MADRAVLSVASECAPLVKTGGLADVVGALPGALSAAGWRARTLIPAYPGLLARLEDAAELADFGDLFGGPARIVAGRSAGLDLLLLDAPHLFDRPGAIYLGPDGKDWPDNPQRYAALSWAAAEIGRGALTDGWRPELLHLHDWQAGLTAAYLANDPGRPAILTTIHNIAFQGLAHASLLNALRLDPAQFTAEGLEYYGKIGALKAGLIYADAISTVSPTYAQELTTPQFGMGLQGVIARRRGDLYGILNGVDIGVWTPATDPALTAPYSVVAPEGKAANTRALEAEFGLEQDDRAPLFAAVSRLTTQKGLDLLLAALPALVARGGRLALLGSGDAASEAAWLRAAAAHPGRIGVRIGYDEALSHRIFAGAEVALVPSRFEPCGLTQLYGLRYGAVPLVARTGGLADTVIDANDAAVRAGVATGLLHDPGAVDPLIEAIERACDLYADRALWAKIAANGMKHPVGWESSARLYADLYAKLADARGT